jgi:hypothetical protein
MKKRSAKNKRKLCKNASDIKITPLKYKEKDLCKQFYHKVCFLQHYNQFNSEFFIFHIANENISSDAYRIQLGLMGVKAGVADYCILIKGGRVAFLEFKRDSKCKPTPKQKEFSETCLKLEIPYTIKWDVDEAIDWLRSIT